jgi:hypothetical protein
LQNKTLVIRKLNTGLWRISLIEVKIKILATQKDRSAEKKGAEA